VDGRRVRFAVASYAAQTLGLSVTFLLAAGLAFTAVDSLLGMRKPQKPIGVPAKL
jgi:hypothetical protein